MRLLADQKMEKNKKPDFDYSLEALRGIAALFVVAAHALITGPTPDPHPQVKESWRYFFPSHLSVIVFFILSGYVIGLTNAKPITTGRAIGIYLKKRLIRLYPLYVLAILATVAVAALYHTPYSLRTIGGWLLFLQGLVVEVPGYNQPIWSLGYEIAYYLLFILVSAMRWRAHWVACFFLGLGVALYSLQVQPIVLVSYAYGAVFWFLGLSLVRLPKAEKPLEFGTMLAFIGLLLSYPRMNLVAGVIHALRLDVSPIVAPTFNDHPINFSDLSALLVCGPMLLCFTNRILPGKKWLELLAFAMPGLYLVTYIVSGKTKQTESFIAFLLPIGYYVVALLIYSKRKDLGLLGYKVIQRLIPLGSISYGIYIIHYPLFFVFHQVRYFSGTVPAFLFRLVIYLATVLLLGWLLERWLQPWVQKKLA